MRANQKKAPVRRKRVGAETESLIIERATGLFTRYGYNGVSTREIAEACQVTVPTLYLYFQDKRALYLACTLRLFERSTARFMASLDTPGTPQERVLSVCKALAHLLLEDDDLVVIFQRELADSDVEGLGLVNAETFEEPLSKLHALIAEALGREPGPLTAISIFAMSFGLRQYMQVTERVGRALAAHEDPAEALAMHVLASVLPEVHASLTAPKRPAG